MAAFNAESTTDQVIEGISLSGDIALVTGASSGLGVETARALAAAGAEVVMLARDEARLAAAADTLRQGNPAATFHTHLVDLASLDSVRSAASDLLESYPTIQLLINNAGVMACPLMRTADGFEMQFGTNHVGHFLLTCLLQPSLLAGAPGRVVNLSSGGHKFANFNFEDPNYTSREYDKWQAYGESKTANVLFTVGLDARLKDSDVRALAVHPGVILTDLGRHMDEADLKALGERAPGDGELTFKSLEQGAATSTWAATSPDLEGLGGIYLEDCQVAEPATPGSSNGVEAYALDAAAAERLWSLSEELVGERFAF